MKMSQKTSGKKADQDAFFFMTEIFLATTNQGEIKNLNSNRYKQFGAALALALVLAQKMAW